MSRGIAGQVCLEPLERRALFSAGFIPISLVSTATGRQLQIIGSESNDTILIRRDGAGVLVSANDTSQKITGGIGSIRIDALGGNDRVSLARNLNIPAWIYGGGGDDTLVGGAGNDHLFGGGGADAFNGAGGSDVIVAVGDAQADRIAGGEGIDAFWLDRRPDERVIDLSAEEKSSDALHRIDQFTESVAAPPSGSASGPLRLGSASLADPLLAEGAVGYANFSDHSLFSRGGASGGDVLQGQINDCFLLSSISSIAAVDPSQIRSRIVELGDGTYAVRFSRNEADVFVRVDGDLPVDADGALAFAQFGRDQSIWVAIMEKAYAMFRVGKADYASLQGGYMAEVYRDFGFETDSSFAAKSGSALLLTISSALARGSAITFGTGLSKTLPVVPLHAYSVERVLTNSAGQPIGLRLRNPWGIDGAGNDGRNDGYVTLSAAQALKAFWFICIARI